MALLAMLVATVATAVAVPVWVVSQMIGAAAVLAGWTPPPDQTRLDLELEALLDSSADVQPAPAAHEQGPPPPTSAPDSVAAAMELANSIGIVDLALRSNPPSLQGHAQRRRRHQRERPGYIDPTGYDRHSRAWGPLILLGLGLGLGSCAVMVAAAGTSTVGGPKPPTAQAITSELADRMASEQQRDAVAIADKILGPDGGCHLINERVSITSGVVNPDDPTLWHWTMPVGWCSDTPAEGYSCTTPGLYVDARGTAWAHATPVARCDRQTS